MSHGAALTVRLGLVAALLSPALAGPAPSDPLAPPGALEPHLAALPRTPAEAARIAAITAPTRDFTAPEPYEDRPAGAATTRARADHGAFSQPSANLPPAQRMDFELGHTLFDKLWVSSPASTKASDGLGPLYNARACGGCHIHDGRGHPPDTGPDDPASTGAVSLVLHVSVPGGPGAAGIAGWHASQPDPVYGWQLQDFATPGQHAEARPDPNWRQFSVELADGTRVPMRAPDWQARDLAYGALHPEAQISARVAPAMIGLGLLAAIPAADILALADPDDADGDGISGRANIVPDPNTGAPLLGRFGLKAGAATLRSQTAMAFARDMGLSTPLFPEAAGDCSPAQRACRSAPDGRDAEGYEVDAEALDAVTFYAANLAVPARRDLADPQVLRGKSLFYGLGCTGCHRPKFVTHRLPDRPEHSFQLIWPYSDLLLHDMGEGLADARPEGRATGREWRTPPLWGIGLAQQVSPEARYLHDGRARSLPEAILWHGGEAQAPRDGFAALPKPDRDALIRFLESL